jgi:hypothetical protein
LDKKDSKSTEKDLLPTAVKGQSEDNESYSEEKPPHDGPQPPRG